MNPTTVKITSLKTLPPSLTSLSGLPSKAPAIKHRAANRPTNATPAARDGHLPEARLRPECLSVLGDMLDVFESVRADCWPLQRASGQLEPASGLLPDAESVGEFVREHLIAAPGSSLTMAQAYSRYRIFCALQGRAIVSRNSFDGLVDCQVAHHLRLRLCDRVSDADGILQPGWLAGPRIFKNLTPHFLCGFLGLAGLAAERNSSINKQTNGSKAHEQRHRSTRGARGPSGELRPD